MKAEVKLKIDISVLRKRMGTLANQVIPYMKETMKKAIGPEIIKTLRYYTPETGVDPKTGAKRTRIRELWDMDYTRRGATEEYIFKNLYENQDVILFFEEGTKEHDIHARYSPVLHWIDEDTREDAYAKFVTHPGTAAYRMVQKTREVVQPLLDAYIQRVFRTMDKMIGK